VATIDGLERKRHLPGGENGSTPTLLRKRTKRQVDKGHEGCYPNEVVKGDEGDCAHGREAKHGGGGREDF